MKSEEIHFGDWMRMLAGNVPGVFYIELIIRAFFVYFVLVMAMRLLGKRMGAQLSRNEMAAMSSLAAAIGIPIQSPERGLLPMFVIAIVVVVVGRAIAKGTNKSQKFEYISQGNIDILVQDSVMFLERMKQVRISTDQLCAQLRSAGIKHLGEVKRLYIEANGNFTLIKEKSPVPGLSVLPAWDEAFRKEQKQSAVIEVCKNCGNKRMLRDEDILCTNCGNATWEKAVE